MLWPGDILGAYGVILLVGAGVLLRCRDRTLALAALVSWLIVGGGGAAMALAGSEALAVTLTPFAVAARLAEWIPTLVLQPLGLLGAVALGVLAARHQLLERAAANRRMLLLITVGGLSVAAAGAVPRIVQVLGGGASEGEVALGGALHSLTGYGGIGYAAGAALISTYISGRGPVSRALAACGQRSLSSYLAQSALFAGVMAPTPVDWERALARPGRRWWPQGSGRSPWSEPQRCGPVAGVGRWRLPSGLRWPGRRRGLGAVLRVPERSFVLGRHNRSRGFISSCRCLSIGATDGTPGVRAWSGPESNRAYRLGLALPVSSRCRHETFLLHAQRTSRSCVTGGSAQRDAYDCYGLEGCVRLCPRRDFGYPKLRTALPHLLTRPTDAEGVHARLHPAEVVRTRGLVGDSFVVEPPVERLHYRLRGDGYRGSVL